MPQEPPEKLWELLRRNDRFRNLAARLQELRQRAEQANHLAWELRQTAEKIDRPAEAKAAKVRHEELFAVSGNVIGSGAAILHCLRKINLFAADALRWLAPLPLFYHSTIALPRGYDMRKKNWRNKEIEWDELVVRLGRGVTPDPHDSTPGCWIWFTSETNDGPHRMNSAVAKNSRSGLPLRWGPIVNTVTTKDRRLKKKCCDEITEWRAYFANRHFDLDTPWNETPPGLQRRFRLHWSNLPGGNTDAYETDFFRNPVLQQELTRLSNATRAANEYIRDLTGDLDRVRRGDAETVCPPDSVKDGVSIRQVRQFKYGLSGEAAAKALEFAFLSEKRVFVLPHPLTKSYARTIFKKLGEKVASELPKTRDLMGTAEFWNTFLDVEAIERSDGLDTGEAIHRYIRRKWSAQAIATSRECERLDRAELNRWFRDGLMLPPPHSHRELQEWKRVRDTLQDVLTQKVDARHHTTVKTRVEYMQTLAKATFPRLNFAALTALPPHKRKQHS